MPSAGSIFALNMTGQYHLSSVRLAHLRTKSRLGCCQLEGVGHGWPAIRRGLRRYSFVQYMVCDRYQLPQGKTSSSVFLEEFHCRLASHVAGWAKNIRIPIRRLILNVGTNGTYMRLP